MFKKFPSTRVADLWRQFSEDHSQDIIYEYLKLDHLLMVWDASDYVYRACIKNPELLLTLFDSGNLQKSYTDNEMRKLLAKQLIDVENESQLSIALRKFRREQIIRIIWRDITQSAPLDETMSDLSALAEVCVDESVKFLYQLAIANGVPRNKEGIEQELIVIGMGKLGARELNLSSDIDLIFVYPDRGQTDGKRSLDNEQFFTRLARQVIKVIGETTDEGFVFRVDTRLRPYGEAGPLVITLDFLEEYLQAQARDWERYAMVKARVISGSKQSSDAFEKLIQPFVYRRYLDYGAIESIREMKQLISNEINNRGMDANIKLGKGGIREIEFLGQAFQLIRGGRDAELQIRPIQMVLTMLAEKNLLPLDEVDQLKDAYVFLRLTENRLQAWKDEQTHLLPADEEAQKRLSRAMNFKDWTSFSEALENHRNMVHQSFDFLFEAPQLEDKTADSAFVVWQEGLSNEAGITYLISLNFSDPQKVWEQLVAFKKLAVLRHLGPKGRSRLEQLMPLILKAVSQQKDSEILLARMLYFLECVVTRTAYLALMIENPKVLSLLVRLMSESAWIAEQISRHPLLLDELIDPRRLYSPLNNKDLKTELAASLSLVTDDEERIMENLRLFVQTNMLRVAAADITGAIPVEVVSDYLSEIAQVVTGYIYDSSLTYMLSRYGMPQVIKGEESGFAVIAYGKLGGWELGYGSDLDLVFLHDSQSTSAMTDGEKSVANDVFYMRLAQRMVFQYTTRTPSGILYEADVRLRPNGKSGLLVSSLIAFEKYQLNDAWTWEHQALIRARAVAGDLVTISEFEVIRRKVLAQKRDVATLQQDVRDMRERMRSELDKSDALNLDLKQGVGGIADIEFMVQYAVLRWAFEYPSLLDKTDNAHLLEVLAKEGLLVKGLANNLLKAYRLYRAEYHHRTLQKQDALILREKFSRECEMVEQAWQMLMLEKI